MSDGKPADFKKAPKSKGGLPGALLSSESSSSGDLSPKRYGARKGNPAGNLTKKMGVPPPPAAKDSIFGAAFRGNVSDDPLPKPAWSSADPLLSVDTHPAAMQRVKSAVIVRRPSTKPAKAPHPASMELRPSDYQVLDRSTSKAGESKAGARGPSQRPSSKFAAKEMGKREPGPFKPSEAPKGEQKPSRAPTSKLQGQGVKHSSSAKGGATQRPAEEEDPSSDDAWGESFPMPRERDEVRRAPVPKKNMVDGKVEDTESSSAEKLKTLHKQAPKPPTERAPPEDEGNVTAWSDDSGAVSRKRQLSSSAVDAHTALAGHESVRELEGQLARSNTRVVKLENMLKDATRRHEEELERERSQHRESLQKEVERARVELEAAVERSRKEADARAESRVREEKAKMEEIKKEALASQNNMKMHCAASVRELKEQVASLEQQLKTKAEDFEKERRVLLKSFEDKRKGDVEAQERKSQALQDEVKHKESELAEQQKRIQALTNSVQTLTTSLAQMKELNDVSRTATQALEEKSKTQAAYIQTLMKREENMKSQAAKLMPIKEAKRLAFRALLKGRAVEMISRACVSTDAGLWNKAWAFQQLVDLIGGPRGSEEKRQDAIESRLMQFRKEQMFLMAENERLMAKVAQLQQEGVNHQQSKTALLEQALIEDDISVTNSSSGFNKISREQALHPRWLVLSVQHLFNKRMAWAFLRLTKVTTEAESNTTIDKLQKKFNELRISAYKEMAARIGSYQLASYIRGVQKRLLYGAFYRLVKNADRFAQDEAFQQAMESTASRDPFFKGGVEANPPFDDAYTPPNYGKVNLNAPLAHQPHYYRQLPSVRNTVWGRNVFLPMIEPSPPVQGYLPHPGYTYPHLTVGVPPTTSKGQRLGTSPTVPNAFPSGPYDATQHVDARGAFFRMRGTQQELNTMMRGGARIVGKK